MGKGADCVFALYLNNGDPMKRKTKIIGGVLLFAILALLISSLSFAAASPTGYEESDGFINSYTGAPLDYAYSFAVIGDTQTVVKKDMANGTTYLSAIYDWLLKNKTARKIQYVFGLGDITENDTDEEWAYAKGEITKLDGVIPYLLNRGNSPHDSAKQLNKYFGGHTAYTETLSGTKDSASVVNSYVTFSIGDVKYLVLALDFGPSDDELEWASGVITDHPDCKVIITTHAYLYDDGTLQGSEDGSAPNVANGANTGEMMWDKLVKRHKNILMVLSGHNPSANIVYNQTAADGGNVVTSMLIDPQNFDAGKHGETGMVAMLYFSADGMKVSVEYISTVREQYYKAENQFTLNLGKTKSDVVTEYGVVPAQYSDEFEWPFVIFKKEATTVNGTEYAYTFYKAAKVLMKNETLGLTANTDFAYHLARSAGADSVILMRRDYVDTSTAGYTNLAYNKGTVTFDLGGFTLTDRHTHNTTLFYSHEKNVTTGDTTFRVTNGTILLSDKGLTNYSEATDCTGNRIHLLFEKITLGFTPDSTVSNVLGRYTGDEDDLFSLTFRDSVIDLANARAGVNLLTTGTKRGAIDFTFENTAVINSPVASIKLSATLADSFILNVLVKATTPNSNITHGSIVFDGKEYALDECERVTVGTIEYYKFEKPFAPHLSAQTVDFTLKFNHSYKYSDGSTKLDVWEMSYEASIIDYLETVIKTGSSRDQALAGNALSYVKAAYIHAARDNAGEVSTRIDSLIGAGFDEKNMPTISEFENRTEGLSAVQPALGSSFYLIFTLDGTYSAEAYKFTAGGESLTDCEIVTIGNKTKIIVKLNVRALVSDVEYTIDGTDIRGKYNISSYHSFAAASGDPALVKLIERLIAFAEKAYLTV